MDDLQLKIIETLDGFVDDAESLGVSEKEKVLTAIFIGASFACIRLAGLDRAQAVFEQSHKTILKEIIAETLRDRLAEMAAAGRA